MLFNSGSSKPAQGVLLPRKKKVQIHPTISLNKIQVERASHHKQRRIQAQFQATYRYFCLENKQWYICNKKNSDIVCHRNP